MLDYSIFKKSVFYILREERNHLFFFFTINTIKFSTVIVDKKMNKPLLNKRKLLVFHLYPLFRYVFHIPLFKSTCGKLWKTIITPYKLWLQHLWINNVFRGVFPQIIFFCYFIMKFLHKKLDLC